MRFDGAEHLGLYRCTHLPHFIEKESTSFRNLEKVLVVTPAELEVASLVWARSLVISEAALPLVLGRAGAGNGEEAAE